MTEIKGIDVARYQGDIDFKKINDAGYKFVIAKATEGSEAGSKIIDPFYKKNIAGAKAAGLAVHAYHFFRGVSENDARAEADWLLKNLTGNESYLFCDVEATGLIKDPNRLTAIVNAFFDQLAKSGHTKLGIYSGKSYFENRLVESKLRPGLLIWIARYNDTLGRDAHIWQHTSSARVPGISGDVDENIAYTDAIVGGSGKVSNPAESKVAVKTFTKGSASVKSYQALLNKFGYKLAVDGLRGPKTNAAVKDFQRKHGLAVDGIVGPKTLAALKKGPAKKSSSAVVPYPGHLIKQGSKGKDVQRIQNAVGVTADGIYGPKTADAVKAYQKRHGLAVDGIVGKQTWSVMF